MSSVWLSVQVRVQDKFRVGSRFVKGLELGLGPSFRFIFRFQLGFEFRFGFRLGSG